MTAPLGSWPDLLAPAALDATPAQAYASHRARAAGLAGFFARTRPLSAVQAGQADENNTVALIAHFHAVSEDPDFEVNGERSAVAAPAALRRLDRGNGEVGTDLKPLLKRDYDAALKGLVPIAYRYRNLISDADYDHLLRELVPGHLVGGHPEHIEIALADPTAIFPNPLPAPVLVPDAVPETENHLLMIESSRYLFNQLRFDEDRNVRDDNDANGLRRWLVTYLSTIARHDFLEFNSRPYARYSLHPLLNLHEFARDDDVRTAARIVLDYTMVKCALSGDRGRRVGPFRRQQGRINHQAGARDDLHHASGDQAMGFFLAYTGMLDAGGQPAHFPTGYDFPALLAATAAYRPPPAAYALATPGAPGSFHRFHHGARPRLRGAPEDAEAGLEMYHQSPSFLLTAGGSFLNSGYGNDQVDLFAHAWRQTSRAQAVTLIPKRADVRFHDLIRFEPYPDPRIDPDADDPQDSDSLHSESVNIGVHRGLIAGANLRPAEKKSVIEQEMTLSPSFATHGDRTLVAWRGADDEHIHVAEVQATSLLGIDGVEGVQRVVRVDDRSGLPPATTDRAPALASHGGRVFVAWKGSGNPQLNLAFSDDGGATFTGTTTFSDSSEFGPALVSHDGRLRLAWVGRTDDQNVNVATVQLLGNTSGAFSIGALESKVVLGARTEASPALASTLGRLFVAWKGKGNDNINIASSDDGSQFGGTVTYPETCTGAPSLVARRGELHLGWRGSGNDRLNVGRVLIGNPADPLSIGPAVEAKVVLDETSDEAPALGVTPDGMLVVGWRGEGDDELNLRVSRDATFRAPGPWIVRNLEDLGFYVAAYRTPPANGDDLDPVPDSLGLVYATEIAAAGMDFPTFEQRIKELNAALPARIGYGEFHRFHAPDGRVFSIHFQLTGNKYGARIVDLAEPLGDLTTLPLVSGEFMTAPGGHDGKLEIRRPGAEHAPLVLDFRNPAQPAYLDNRRSDPQPWVERTVALLALAGALTGQGRRAQARSALRDAAPLYGEMVRLDPGRHGPVLAPAVLAGLGLIRADFSVPEAELLEWLANPEFTPYPAIAEALLQLGLRLRAPVFLDVIVFNYEHTPGVVSPRRSADVRTDLLLQAVLEGANVRHGTAFTDVEHVIES